MCLTCGCGEAPGVTTETTETLDVEERLLAKNDELAAHVRASLAERHVTALNLMSSPGAGKTSLLERTVAELGTRHAVCVIEGDQETSFDADRIRRAGARAVQINTGAGCHLDAAMVHRALHELDPPTGSLLFVENVGNLVCPSSYDLGEDLRLVGRQRVDVLVDGEALADLFADPFEGGLVGHIGNQDFCRDVRGHPCIFHAPRRGCKTSVW